MGCIPLKKGVKIIGAYDCIWFLLDLALMILTAVGVHNFIMPKKDKFWILLLELILVDSLRVISFIILLKYDASKNSRSIMLIARVITVPLEIAFMILTFIAIHKVKIGLLFFDLAFILLNVYFGFVIYSYYLTTDAEEI